MPNNEQIFVINEDDETATNKYIPLETLRHVSTPQAYEFEELDQAYHEAFEKENENRQYVKGKMNARIHERP